MPFLLLQLYGCTCWPGFAAAEGVLLKEIKWRQNCNYMGYRFVAIAIENGGLLSDTTLGLLDELTNRLPARPQLFTR